MSTVSEKVKDMCLGSRLVKNTTVAELVKEHPFIIYRIIRAIDNINSPDKSEIFKIHYKSKSHGAEYIRIGRNASLQNSLSTLTELLDKLKLYYSEDYIFNCFSKHNLFRGVCLDFYIMLCF